MIAIWNHFDIPSDVAITFPTPTKFGENVAVRIHWNKNVDPRGIQDTGYGFVVSIAGNQIVY